MQWTPTPVKYVDDQTSFPTPVKIISGNPSKEDLSPSVK